LGKLFFHALNNRGWSEFPFFGPDFETPAPVVSWSALPPVSILSTGDSVLRVKIDLIASAGDPRDVDRNHPHASHPNPAGEGVIIACFAPSIYTVLGVMDGDDPGGSTLLQGIQTGGEGPDQDLDGRVIRLKDTMRDGPRSGCRMLRDLHAKAGLTREPLNAAPSDAMQHAACTLRPNQTGTLP
jgi:hypothetical protein